jgi:hypothetical protein
MSRKAPMHWSARAIGIDLHEQLGDHVSGQPFANGGQIPRRVSGASLAGESDFGTNLGDIVVAQRVHVETIMPLTYS